MILWANRDLFKYQKPTGFLAPGAKGAWIKKQSGEGEETRTKIKDEVQ